MKGTTVLTSAHRGLIKLFREHHLEVYIDVALLQEYSAARRQGEGWGRQVAQRGAGGSVQKGAERSSNSLACRSRPGVQGCCTCGDNGQLRTHTFSALNVDEHNRLMQHTQRIDLTPVITGRITRSHLERPPMHWHPFITHTVEAVRLDDLACTQGRHAYMMVEVNPGNVNNTAELTKGQGPRQTTHILGVNHRD